MRAGILTDEPLNSTAAATSARWLLLLVACLANQASGQDRGTPRPAVLPPPTSSAAPAASPATLPRPTPQPLQVAPAARSAAATPAGRVQIAGDILQTRDEDAATVQLLSGRVRIAQGATSWTGRQVVLWSTPEAGGSRLEFVFDGPATVSSEAGNRSASGRLFTLQSPQPPEMTIGLAGGRIAENDPVVRRASETRAIAPKPLPPPVEEDGVPAQTVQQAGPALGTPLAPSLAPLLPPGQAPFNASPFNNTPFGNTPFGAPGLVPPGLQVGPGGVVLGPRQRISITPRSIEIPFVLESRPNLRAVPAEQIITVTRGVNIVIERPAAGEVLDLTADSAVIWTAADAGGSGLGFDLDIGPNTPFQVYLRGNIVLRTGGTVARAREAFFDRADGRGLLLGTEVRQLVPDLRGDLRLRAETVRFEVGNPNLAAVQPSDLNMRATNAWVSASQFGVPTYRLEAGEVLLSQRPGGTIVDPRTGRPQSISRPWITTRDNRFLLGEIPVLAAPEISFPAEEFTIPLRRLTATYDRTFGAQLLTRWSLDDLLNLDTPPGSRLDLNLNYLSARGPQFGPEWGYDFLGETLGMPSRSYGLGEASFLYDAGEDRLGLDRRDIDPVDNARGFLDARHRTLFPQGWSATVAGGYVSDRNFLEQFQERRWDTGQDVETLLELRQVQDNRTLSALLQPQVNDFFNTTGWLPRLDATLLGQPLGDSPLLWSTHSQVGYGRINQTDALPFSAAELAENPAEVLTPLGYFPEVSGGVLMTRHELSLPVDLGALQLAPYVMGEVLHQEEGLDGTGLTRLYGVAGVRGAVAMTRIDRSVQNDILGLDGLAHKMVFDFDYSVAESSVPLSEVAQYNAFDDNAQERFRERLTQLTYGGVLPLTADPRVYALRSGAGRAVTAPHYELVDDQHVLRLGWRHRWQTKTGPLSNRRIRDWMTLDLEASIFPSADAFTAEDNFGEALGLLGARYAWNVGERTTLLADGLFDPFEPGQQTYSLGLLTQRTARGSLYVGYRSIELGGLDSDIGTIAASYAMSPKWIAVASTSYDFAQSEGRGHQLQLTRVGRDFLVLYGLNYDTSKNDFGASILIEPLIGPRDGRQVAPLLSRRPAEFGLRR